MAAVQQLADWLKKLGMFEYADRFVENRIDLSGAYSFVGCGGGKALAKYRMVRVGSS